ncbi:CHAT domain-containing tetratricopeptide repeat protein [Kamptonema sp. UHCC 0994]|uniref:CHAT domain-containing tetratricopeptide repeat protein n=1 Tax=Kamptonema sp. UHCC 0994 TaxID=3031329 RepID=UPI0023B9627C|nr:CHAT domain-containing tetratricopeptide repeat protein [Kamptonema sp. UHCC 0994]MDF0554799.1 CHAT domain-containing tetratricopeptide repeat protein [Kamptonema sp. UHCC 0994]
MKRVLAGLLGLGICLSPLRGVAGGVEIDLRPLSVGSQGRELLAQGIDSRKAEAKRLMDQGDMYYQASQFEAAIQPWEQALIIYQQIKDLQAEGALLTNLGNIYGPLGYSKKAIAYHKKALLILRKIKSREAEGATLINLGNTYYSLGDYRKAIFYLEQGLLILQTIKTRLGEGTALGILGNTYSLLGNYKKAIDYQQKYLTIAKEIKDRFLEATALGNLGFTYNEVGDYGKAIFYLEQALVIARIIKYRNGEANHLGNLAGAYIALGDYGKGIFYYKEALTIFQEIKYRNGEAIALGNLGNAYSLLGDYRKQIDYNKQYLTIAREIKDRLGEANALGNLGYAYESLGNYEKGIAFHQQALAIAREIKERKSEGNELNNLGNALLKSGKLLEAEQSLREGIKVWESLRTGLEDADKISIFEGQARTYKLLQKVLITQNRYTDALEISERGRTRAFVELLAQRLNANQPSSISIQPPSIDSIKTTAKQQNATIVEYSIIYDTFKIQDRLQGKESELYIWVIQPNGNVTFRAVDLKPLWQSQEPVESQNITPINLFWQQNLQTYSYPIIILLLVIVMGSFTTLAYSAVYADKTSKKSQAFRPKLAQTLLGLVATSGTISLIFLLIQMQNQQSLEVATRSPQQPKSPLAKLVFSAQESLGVRNRGLLQITSGQSKKTIKENWQQLHQILIQPIADLLPTDPNSRIIFIPQNDLFFVPFPALIDANGKYLIEKHTILTAPSIQVLSLTHQQRQRLGASRLISSITNPNFLVVGNPTMPKISQYPGEPAIQLDDLPGAEKEATEIANLLKTNAIIGNQATKTAIVEKMPQARIIHLATHGLLNDLYTGDIPGAIALAPNNQGDGLLTSREILQMKLNAELVVLSACDTGKGRITGDGIIGLSRALFTAGVPSAIVSLWPINDGSTAFLMANFYQNLQQNPNKAQALRQAMLVTMKKYPDPRSWAAFTLMGEAE